MVQRASNKPSYINPCTVCACSASRLRLAGSRFGRSASQRLNSTKVIGEMVCITAILPVAPITTCEKRRLGQELGTFGHDGPELVFCLRELEGVGVVAFLLPVHASLDLAGGLVGQGEVVHSPVGSKKCNRIGEFF